MLSSGKHNDALNSLNNFQTGDHWFYMDSDVFYLAPTKSYNF